MSLQGNSLILNTLLNIVSKTINDFYFENIFVHDFKPFKTKNWKTNYFFNIFHSYNLLRFFFFNDFQ